MIGAGAVLVYALARESSSSNNPSSERQRLIDWEWATKVAIRSAGRAPTLHPSAQAPLQAQYQQLLGEIEAPIAAYTGTALSLANTTVVVMDRPAWIRTTLRTFEHLLQPVEELYQQAIQPAFGPTSLGSPLVLHGTARLMVSTQIGALVGYLSRRVLGQYDLALLGPETAAAGKLYFVEPNLRQVEHTLNVPRDEFRRWIALHEATHAHEFELHPWVRPYMDGLLRRYLRLLMDDLAGKNGPAALTAIPTRLLGNLRNGHSLLAALMTPEQRDLMSRLQALMSLAEGYSNHVMNGVGRGLLPNFQQIHDRVEARQARRSQMELVLLKVTGLALKMEQYRLGEHFVDEVTRQRGIAFANLAWDAPETLPTEAEIRDPARWIRRLEVLRAA